MDCPKFSRQQLEVMPPYCGKGRSNWPITFDELPLPQPGVNQEGTVTPSELRIAGPLFPSEPSTWYPKAAPKLLYFGFGVLICARFDRKRVPCCPM